MALLVLTTFIILHIATPYISSTTVTQAFGTLQHREAHLLGNGECAGGRRAH